MTPPQIYISRMLPTSAFELLRAVCNVRTWEEETPPPRALFLREISDCDGVLLMLTEKLDAEALAAAPNLRVISNMAVGVDNVDIAAATARHIPVGHTPGVLTETSADLAFALLMAAARRLPEGERYVHTGQWKTWFPTQLLGQDIHGATLGIIGFGRIGQAVARRGKGFNMRLLYSGGRDDDAAQALGAIYRD